MRGALAMLAVTVAAACGTTEPPARRSAQIVLEQGNGFAELVAVFGGEGIFGTPGATRGECSAFMGSSSLFGTFGAGELDFAGTTMPIQLAQSGVDPMVQYPTNVAQDGLFMAGATLTMTAQGGDGPDDLGPFSEHVTAPAAITGVTAPAMLSRSGGTALTWDAGTSTAVWIVMLDADNPAAVVICAVHDTGSYAIPASAFLLLSPTTQQVELELARVDGQIERVGDTAVQLMAIELLPESTPVPLGP